jgi:acyl-CoA synthetase (NDP forming)/GNAT superfamily N-acetyltransferase
MTVGRPANRRSAPERLFRPTSLAVIGAKTAAGRCLCDNIDAGGFAGPIWLDELPAPPDLAVLACPAQEVGAALRALAAGGGQVAVVTSQVDDLAALARQAGVRVVGPSSFGIAVPGVGLNATLSHLPVPAGRVALVTQSASLARAVIDWAAPNGVGFSHVVGLGGNADVGFGPTLDWLSRDPDTGLIILDMRRIRRRRAFISAARAASRLRPVVAVRPGGRLLDPSGRADAVFAQALHRAGVFVVDGMEPLFAAAETLTRARPLRHETMAVVTNAIGPGRLACDAALRAGIRLAELPQEVQTSLCGSLPAELVHGLVYVGRLPVHVAEAAAMLSAVPAVGGLLVLLTPTGAGDASAIEALVAAVHTAKQPVLSCIMGETTGAGHRARLAQAGMPVFATPEQAVAAFSHLLRDRRARETARELPAARMVEVLPDRDALARVLAARPAPGSADCLALLSAYGIAAGAGGDGQRATLTVHDDAMFGPAIGFSAGACPAAYDLPPLNLALAQDLAHRAGADTCGAVEASASVLVRISQLLVDAPQIAALRINLLLTEAAALAEAAAIALRPEGEVAVLAIAPYPDALVERWHARGESFVVRPIRPEDAQAHAAMIARIPPEDLRFRFFSAVRQISPGQMVRLTQIDYEREMAFIAVRQQDGATVGVSRLVCDAGGTDSRDGEFAILVEPSVKGTGLATHLMDRLIAWAQAQRIGRMIGQILADNHPMLGFVRHMGFALSALPGEPDVLEAVLNLGKDPTPPE